MTEPAFVLAFIGESGSGKSTCINYFANYFAGTNYTRESGFSNIFVVIPNNLFPEAIDGYTSCEYNIRDNSKSQTTACNEYDFVEKANGKTRIKVVDTPGFNDTDASRDDENIQKIIKAFAKLPFISAVIITINGTVARLSTSVKATLSQLRGSLPDSVFDNLFFIFTNCDETGRSFDLDLIAEYKPQPQRIFHMQNSLFSVKSKGDIDNNAKNKARAETNWQDSVDTMNDLMAEVGRTAATSTKVFTDMRISREQLLADKANLIVKQKSLLTIMHELKIESDRLKDAQTNQAANQSYTEHKVIDQVQIEKKSYFSTVCNDSKHGTLQICHENCGLGYQPSLNFEHFKNCAASDGQNCRHCRCSMGQHYHTYEIPVTKKVTTEQIIQSKKAAFDQATQQVSASQSQLQKLSQTRAALQSDADKCKQGILNSIRQLKTFCSHYNFAEEMAATIQKLRQEGKIAQDLHSKKEFNDTADAIENLVKQLTVAS
jgi:GTPase SAR1 family protein